MRDSPVAQSTGTLRVADQRRREPGRAHHGQPVKSRGFDPKLAPMYAQMLVGMVALTGQWWLDARKPAKAVVAAHLVNLAWNGLCRAGGRAPGCTAADGPRGLTVTELSGSRNSSRLPCGSAT